MAVGALAQRVLRLAVILLTVILIRALRRIAEQGSASGEVVNVLEANALVSRVGLFELGQVIVHRHRRLAALVALKTQVGVHRLQITLVVLLGAEGQLRAVGEGYRGDRPAIREVVGVMACCAFEPVGDRLRNDTGDLDAGWGNDQRTIIGKILGQASRAVALGAASWHNTGAIAVPVAEGLGVAGKVTGIIARQLGHINRLGGFSVQVVDRVVEELHDVLGVVGERTRILGGQLVIVSSLQQTSCPLIVGNRTAFGVLNRLTIRTRYEPVRIGRRIINDRGLGHFIGIHLDRAIQDVLQACQFVIDAFLDVAVAVIVDQRTGFAVVLQIVNGLDALMAFRACFNLYRGGMLIVARGAGSLPDRPVMIRVGLQQRLQVRHLLRRRRRTRLTECHQLPRSPAHRSRMRYARPRSAMSCSALARISACTSSA